MFKYLKLTVIFINSKCIINVSQMPYIGPTNTTVGENDLFFKSIDLLDGLIQLPP